MEVISDLLIWVFGAGFGWLEGLRRHRKEINRLHQENAMLKTAIQDRKEINY